MFFHIKANVFIIFIAEADKNLRYLSSAVALNAPLPIFIENFNAGIKIPHAVFAAVSAMPSLRCVSSGGNINFGKFEPTFGISAQIIKNLNVISVNVFCPDVAEEIGCGFAFGRTPAIRKPRTAVVVAVNRCVELIVLVVFQFAFHAKISQRASCDGRSRKEEHGE